MPAKLTYVMSEAEIAEELGLTRSEVRTILHRAIAKIRAQPELFAWFRSARRQQQLLSTALMADSRKRMN